MTFEEPSEVVTITIREVDQDTVDVEYDYVRTPAPDLEAPNRAGAEDMLRRIDEGIQRGLI
jgi:hypothetical protein